MGIDLNLPNLRGFNYVMTIKKVTRSNFDQSWNSSTTVRFHSWSVECSYHMSRVKSYNGLQFALAPPSENSMAMTSYINIVVFKSALILTR